MEKSFYLIKRGRTLLLIAIAYITTLLASSCATGTAAKETDPTPTPVVSSSIDWKTELVKHSYWIAQSIQYQTMPDDKTSLESASGSIDTAKTHTDVFMSRWVANEILNSKVAFEDNSVLDVVFWVYKYVVSTDGASINIYNGVDTPENLVGTMQIDPTSTKTSLLLYCKFAAPMKVWLQDGSVIISYGMYMRYAPVN